MIDKLVRFIHNPKPYLVIISDFIIGKFRNLVAFVAPFSILDDKLFINHRFKEALGYNLNLKEPKTFNEKIQWLKLYYRKPLYTQLADKYAVREFVKEKCGELYLVKLLGVFDQPDEIDWQSLPEKFVIKTTHSSSSNIICENKNKLNIQYASNELNKWLIINHYRDKNSREWHMKDIVPRIVIEEFLNGDPELGLLDYKFYCFWGKPKYVEVHIDRFRQHSCNIFDITWKQLPYLHGFPKSSRIIPKPGELDEMLSISRKLSAGVPYCRIDLYNFGKKVYFGEVTFTPGGGFDRFDSYKTDLLWGEPLSLPERY